MTRFVPATLAALGALSLAAAASANPDMKDSGRKLSTTLSGAVEVPGPGDPDGSGSFTARINPGQTEVCYDLAVADIQAASAAHIHRGAVGIAGGVVVTLETPSDGSSEACATIDRALAQELIRTPAAFYVNVHNAEYPAGAVRGQLSK